MLGQLYKFIITGALGTTTNIIIFYLLNITFGIEHNFSSIISFIAANIQNYFINNYWSFLAKTTNIKNYIHFLIASLGGLTINLIVLNLIYSLTVDKILFAQIFGIICGSSFNFIIYKFRIFKK